jgi:hypothetical protein
MYQLLFFLSQKKIERDRARGRGEERQSKIISSARFHNIVSARYQ